MRLYWEHTFPGVALIWPDPGFIADNVIVTDSEYAIWRERINYFLCTFQITSYWKNDLCKIHAF
jgi:hypothetical protein